MKTCGPGRFYWACKQACYDIESGVKNGRSDLVIYTRAALGATVFLGDLYDANTNEVSTGHSFWKRSTVLDNRIRSHSPSVSVNVFRTKSTIDRLQSTDISPALKTDILGMGQGSN